MRTREAASPERRRHVPASAAWILTAAVVIGLSQFAQATHCVPLVPSSLTQLNGDSSPLATGGTTAGGMPTSVILRGTVNVGCPGGQSVRLDVEVRPTTSSFTGAVTHSGTTTTPGNPSSVTVTGLTPGTAYKWQARTADLSSGQNSAFTAFAGGATAFTVAAASTGMPGMGWGGRVAVFVGLAAMLLVLARRKAA